MHELRCTGYDMFMTKYTDDQIETIQSVVDRVAGYQDGAPETTVADELRRGFAEAEIEVGSDDVERLATAIDAAAGDVSAADTIA